MTTLKTVFHVSKILVVRQKYSAGVLLSILVLSVTRPNLPLGQIVSGTSNRATRDVYSPNAIYHINLLEIERKAVN